MSTQVNVNPFFSPTQIAGCQLWLDGADSNSVVLSGQNVTQWRDKSGNGNNFSQTSDIRYPVYTTNAINSLPSISFTGGGAQGSSTQCLDNATISINNTAYSIFCVARANASQPSYTGFNYLLKGFIGGDFYLFFGNNPSKFFATFAGTSGGWNDINANTPSISVTSTTLLMGMVISGSVLTPYYNGNSMSTKNGTTGAYSGMRIGDAPNNGNFTGQCWNGLISEIIMFSLALTTSQRQQIEGYLAWKWGLQGSLPATHPYKSSLIPPLLNPPLRLPGAVQNLTPTFSPTQISGCQLWLDAADASTITLSGANVTQWRDKSGLSNNSTATGTITNPISINGLRAMSYPGAASTYFLGNITNTGTTLSVFSVFIMNSGSYAGARIVSLAKPATFDFNNNLYTAPILRRFTQLGAYRNSSDLSVITYTFGTACVFSSIYNGTNNIVYLNGTAGTTVATTGNFGYSNYEIGSSFGEESLAPLDGVIGEVIIYNSSLGASQRQQIEGYLAWKWGLVSNLPVTHPYKQGPPYSATIISPSRSLVIGTTWQPNQISGLQMWLDAAATNTLVLSGSNVTQWNDRSGNGNNTNLVSGTPQYISRGVYFNGSSSMFGPISNTSNVMTSFIVGTINSSSVVDARILSFGVLGLADFTSSERVIPFLRFGTSQAISSYRNPSNATAVAITYDIVFLAATVFNGTNCLFFINGTQGGSIASSTGNFNYSRYGLGQDAGQVDPQRMIGFNYETISYNAALSIAQRQQVEGYLAWKWGLVASLPANHPFKRWPPSP